MTCTLSQEEENYDRMTLLLTGISPRAVRALFDHEFAPACLDSSLNKEYNKLKDLQKKRIINQSQWNLLFPRFPGMFKETFYTSHQSLWNLMFPQDLLVNYFNKIRNFWLSGQFRKMLYVSHSGKSCFQDYLICFLE